jgi:hypothetical protein
MPWSHADIDLRDTDAAADTAVDGTDTSVEKVASCYWSAEVR